jgi:hypothetical protein
MALIHITVAVLRSAAARTRALAILFLVPAAVANLDHVFARKLQAAAAATEIIDARLIILRADETHRALILFAPPRGERPSLAIA